MPNSLIRYNYGGVRWWSHKIIKFLWSNLGLGGFSKSIVSVVLVSVDLNTACGPPNVIYFLKAITKTCPHDPKIPIQLVPNPFNPSILKRRIYIFWGEFWRWYEKRPSHVAPHLYHLRLRWRQPQALWEWEGVLWEKWGGGYPEDLWCHRKADRHCLSWVSINMNSATMSNFLGLLALFSETVFLGCHKMGEIFSILLSRPL